MLVSATASHFVGTNEPMSLVAAVRDTRGGTGAQLYPNLFINNTGLTPTGALGGAVTVQITAYANSSGLPIGTPITIQNLGPGQTATVSTLTDGGGKTSTLSRDAEAVPTAVRNPTGQGASQTTDKLGAPITSTDAGGAVSAFSRDAMQRITRSTDPLGHTSTLVYDPRGLLSGYQSGSGATISVSRDDAGRPAKVTDAAGGNWLNTYTPAGRLLTSVDPAGRTQSFTYDTQGRLSRITYPDSASATLTYDVSGNLTHLAYSDGTDLTWGFDGLNRLIAAGDVAITRDAEGNVQSTTQNGIRFGATYDPAGRVSAVTYDNALVTVSYTYDARNLVTRVSDNLSNAFVTFTYDDAARLTGIQRSNGVNATYGIDANGRINSINDGPFLNVQLTRDAAGQVITESGNVPVDDQAMVLPGAQSFGYDASGAPAGGTSTVDSRGRLTSSPTASITYDAASRPTMIGGAKLTWNALNQLVTKTENGHTTTLFYDRHFLAAEKVQPEGSVRYYVHTPSGLPLYFFNAAMRQPTFYHYDHNGSTVALTNGAGQMTDSYAYDPTGLFLGHNGATAQPFGYFGAFNLRSDGGLYLAGDRAIDPASIVTTGPPVFPGTRRIEPPDRKTLLREQYAKWIADQSTSVPLLVTYPKGDDSVFAGLGPGPLTSSTITAMPQRLLGSRDTAVKKPPIPATQQKTFLIITQTDVEPADVKRFAEVRDRFHSELLNRRFNVLEVSSSQLAGLHSDPNANIGLLTTEQLNSVTGIITVGHSNPDQLAGYLNAPIVKALLDRTGPLDTFAMWGCNSFRFYEQNTNLFYPHLKQGGPVGIFGFSTYLNQGSTQLGFAKNIFESDPLLEFLDGTRGGGEYSIFDFSGWFWGKVLSQ